MASEIVVTPKSDLNVTSHKLDTASFKTDISIG